MIILYPLMALALGIGLYLIRLLKWIEKKRFPSTLRTLCFGWACIVFSLILFIDKFFSSGYSFSNLFSGLDPTELLKLITKEIFLPLLVGILVNILGRWQNRKNRIVEVTE